MDEEGDAVSGVDTLEFVKRARETASAEARMLAGKSCYEAYSRVFALAGLPGEPLGWEALPATAKRAWVAAALWADGPACDEEQAAVQPVDVVYVDDMTSGTTTSRDELAAWFTGVYEPAAEVLLISGAHDPGSAVKKVRTEAADTADSLQNLTQRLAAKMSYRLAVDADALLPAEVIASYASAIKDITLSALEWHHMSKDPKRGDSDDGRAKD